MLSTIAVGMKTSASGIWLKLISFRGRDENRLCFDHAQSRPGRDNADQLKPRSSTQVGKLIAGSLASARTTSMLRSANLPASPSLGGARICSMMRSLAASEERAPQSGICGQNSGDRLSLSSADVSDVPKPGKIVSLDQCLHGTCGQRWLDRKSYSPPGARRGTANRCAVQAVEGVLTGFDALQKMPATRRDVRRTQPTPPWRSTSRNEGNRPAA
jgi:hypothetical protein